MGAGPCQPRRTRGELRLSPHLLTKWAHTRLSTLSSVPNSGTPGKAHQGLNSQHP